MLEKVSWLFSISIVVCLTIQFSQSQVPGRPGANNQAGRQETPPHRFESQSRLILDARDKGVDCTGATDSSMALNAITDDHGLLNGVAFTFPVGCNINLANTWTIKNGSAFKITGVSGAGANGVVGAGVPTFTWTGSAGGTMIDMEYVDGFSVENIGLNGNGLAYVGINVDKTGTCTRCVNTTDGLFRRLYILGNDTGNNWNGISFSAVSGSNVEDMRVLDSSIKCNSLTAGKGVAGITLGNSFNAKNEQFIHNNISNCAIGVNQVNGTMDLEYTEFGGNILDVFVGTWSDPNEHIDNNLSESDQAGEQFFKIGGAASAHPLTINGNNIPYNSTCAVELSNSIVELKNNTFYSGMAGAGTGAKLCNANGLGNGVNLRAFGNRNLTQADVAGLVLAQSVANPIDAALLVGKESTQASFIPRSTGALFLERIGAIQSAQSNNGLNFNASVQSSIPCAINTWCGMEGGFEVAGVVTPDGLAATATGGRGTTYGFYVSAVDASGSETLLRGGQPYLLVSGPATLNGTTNYLTIKGLGSPIATSCNIYAVNTRNALQVNQIATGVSCSANWSYQVNSYPSTWPITTLKSPFNKTLSFLFRGREVDFQYGTSLNGFSDKGVAKTWSIDSRGAANFTGLKLGSSGPGLSQMKIYSTASVTPTAVRGATCSDQTFALEGVTTADRVSNVTPPGVLGNVSINAYISARDTLLLHFCNPGASNVSPPRGIYSVLAVH